MRDIALRAVPNAGVVKCYIISFARGRRMYSTKPMWCMTWDDFRIERGTLWNNIAFVNTSPSVFCQLSYITRERDCEE